MHKSITIIIAILVAGGLVAYYLHLEHNRYEITTTSKFGPLGIAYEVDKKTGDSWMLIGEKKIAQETPIPLKELSEEEKAIKLARSANTFDKSKDNDSFVKKVMQELKGSIKIIGWEARKYDDQTYVVSYKFTRGDDDIEVSLEVNLVAELVREIKGDPDLEKKYGIGK